MSPASHSASLIFGGRPGADLKYRESTTHTVNSGSSRLKTGFQYSPGLGGHVGRSVLLKPVRQGENLTGARAEGPGLPGLGR